MLVIIWEKVMGGQRFRGRERMGAAGLGFEKSMIRGKGSSEGTGG